MGESSESAAHRDEPKGIPSGDADTGPGAGWQPSSVGDATCQHEAGPAQPPIQCSRDSIREGDEIERTLVKLEKLGVDPETIDGIRGALLVEHHVAWGGLLPHPQSFSQYANDVQERIMRWNDAFTVDESARQDRLVECEIKEAQRGSMRTSFFLLLCLILAAVSVFVFESMGAAALFLGVPVLSIVGGFIRDVRSQSSRKAT